MQQITINGFLSRDAEKASTRDGTDVTRWNVPVNQGYGDNKTTNWFRISIWGKRADYASNARKGDAVFVTGDLTIGEYEGKPQYEIRAGEFQFVTPAPKGERKKPYDDGLENVQRFGKQTDDLDEDRIPF